MADISQLVQRAKSGDRSAFDRLYSETCRAVYYTCLGFMKNEEDARDVMQDVYLTAFEKLGSLSDPAKFGAWINRIAVNTSKNHLAKKGAHPELSVDEKGFEEPAAEILLPEEYLENAEKRRQIMEIIKGCLSDAQYQTVIMFYFDGMSIAEIAESMSCPEGTVKYRLNAARAKITQAVLDYEEENDERLHAFAGVPFLTRLLYSDANGSDPPPQLSLDQLLLNNHLPQIPDSSASAAVKGGKVMLNSLKAKIIAGACAVAVVGGGVTAGVVISNNTKRSRERPTTSQPAPYVSSGGNGGFLFSSPSGGGAVSNPQSNSPDIPDVPATNSDLWEYKPVDGGLMITKYKGNEERVVVPAELDGNTVLAIDDSNDEEGLYVFSEFGRENKTKEIVISEGITSIGLASFAYLENLESVHIPDSVTSIGYGAFSNCTSLDNVIFPEGETDFEFVFDNCKSLKTVKLPESAEKLWNTFYACTSLESVTIPANVTEFDIVFERCTNLKEVIFEGNKIKEIGHSSFISCSSLESIVIPDGVEKLGAFTFNGCSSLKSVTLPATLAEIGSQAFSECTALAEITLPDSVSKLDNTAFADSPNVRVTYKGNVYAGENLDDLYLMINGE